VWISVWIWGIGCPSGFWERFKIIIEKSCPSKSIRKYVF
jgi:hypothetical protein